MFSSGNYYPDTIYVMPRPGGSSREKHKWIDDFADRHACSKGPLIRDMQRIVALKGAKIDETVGDSLVGHAQVSHR
jgi:hypothetical protein